MADKIKFLKTREVKSPSRAYDYDAGIDLYVPKFDKEFIEDFKKKNPDMFKGVSSACFGNISVLTLSGGTNSYNTGSPKVEFDLEDKNDTIIKFDDETGLNYFLLVPGGRANIPSGIKVRMAEPGRAFIAFNKSGVATKLGLVAGACVVDYLYQGEVHLSVINTSTKIVRIYEDMKLLQFIEMPVFNSDIDVTSSIDGVYPINPDDFYYGMSKERGEGGFGSSDQAMLDPKDCGCTSEACCQSEPMPIEAQAEVGDPIGPNAG